MRFSIKRKVFQYSFLVLLIFVLLGSLPKSVFAVNNNTGCGISGYDIDSSNGRVALNFFGAGAYGTPIAISFDFGGAGDNSSGVDYGSGPGISHFTEYNTYSQPGNYQISLQGDGGVGDNGNTTCSDSKAVSIGGTINISSNVATSWDIGGPQSFSGGGTGNSYSAIPGGYSLSAATLAGYDAPVISSNPNQQLNNLLTINYTITYTPTASPPPTCDIKANGSNGPISVPSGSNVNITWSSTNSTSANIDGTPVGTSGSSGDTLTQPRTYTFNTSGSGGSCSDSVTVNIDGAPPTQTHFACQSNSCIEVSGSGSDSCNSDSDCASQTPTQTPQPGQVNLNFLVKNQNTQPISGASVDINQNFGNGTNRSTDGSGFANFGVNQNTSIGWTVSATNCTGTNGTKNVGTTDATVNVTLNCTAPTVPGCTNPSANNYNPSATADDGSCTYSCSGPSSQACTSGTNACGQTSDGTQTRTCDASSGNWGGWGSCSATTPANPAGYSDACTSSPNACGQTNSGTIQCDSSCSVTQPLDNLCPAPTISSFTCSPNPVGYNSPTTLIWSSANTVVNSCSIPGIVAGGTAPGDGSHSTPNLTTDTSYTVTCQGLNGSPVSADITCNVSGPTCAIQGNGVSGPITVPWNSNVTIAWQSTNAGSGVVTPPGWTGTSGSHLTGNLNVPSTYVYTATLSGNGSASCNQFVTVSNPIPTASSITYSPPDYCSSGPGGYVAWSYSDPSGSPQTAYEVKIGSYDSGKLPSSSHIFAIPNGVLAFNNTYNAQVMVWNTYDQPSAWSAPTSNWSTPPYAYPDVVVPYQFTWPSPPKPQQNKAVQLTDHTLFASGGNHQWSWNFGDGGSSVLQNPAHTFTAIGNYTITETATDAANQSCSNSESINIQKPIPVIKEVAPR